MATIADTQGLQAESTVATLAVEVSLSPFLAGIAADAAEVGERDGSVSFSIRRMGRYLSSPLTVSVLVEEPVDDNRMLAEEAPFTREVVFPAGASTLVHLRLAIEDDLVWEELPTPVTATLQVVGPEYDLLLPNSASVLVLDNDVPVMRFGFVSTETIVVRESESVRLPKAFAQTLRDERPHERVDVPFFFPVIYSSEPGDARPRKRLCVLRL